MGQSHGRVVRRPQEEDESASDEAEEFTEEDEEEEEEIIDALAALDHNDILLRIQVNATQPRHPDEPVLKSACTGDWEGEKAEIVPKTVLLHVYDLEGFETANGTNFLVTTVSLGGAFHAGVEVYGGEWSYGKRGVTCDIPRTVEGHVYRCSIPLGLTALTPAQVASVLQELLQVWKGDEYELLRHNCCSFAAEFCQLLGVGDGFPKWIDRLARHLGGMQEVGMALQGGMQEIGKHLYGAVMEKKDELLGEQDGQMVPIPGLRSMIQVDANSVFLVQQNAPTRRHVPDAAPLLLSRVLTAGQVAPAPRRPSFRPGATVEYRTRRGEWVRSKVVLFDPATGRYNLQHQTQVHPTRVRAPMPRFSVGEKVLYNSATLKRWEEATICSMHHGLYNIDIRPGAVSEDRLMKRPPNDASSVSLPIRSVQRNTVSFEQSLREETPRSVGLASRQSSAKSLPALALGAATPGTGRAAAPLGTLQLGATPKAVTPAGTTPANTQSATTPVGTLTTSAAESQGAVNFNVTPHGSVPVGTTSFSLPPESKLEPRKASESNSDRSTNLSTPRDVYIFPTGAAVEYRSTQTDQWLQAVVKGHYPEGFLKLDIKPYADPSRVRLRTTPPAPVPKAAPATTAPTPTAPSTTPTVKRVPRVTIFCRPEDEDGHDGYVPTLKSL